MALDINNIGQVVGYSFNVSGDTHAFLYTNGIMKDLGTFPNRVSSVATGINDYGQIVGSSATAGGNGNAFLYDNDIMTTIGDPSFNLPYRIVSVAKAINASRQIVGSWNLTGMFSLMLSSMTIEG
ncbi:MAG: hypothetical protein IPL99_16370 [Candidatus Competibacteraceae bacterium]|nr:hypothetical protein [Candidatus Competibacteraceae bacterium]